MADGLGGDFVSPVSRARVNDLSRGDDANVAPARVRVTLRRSLIGNAERQRRIVRALGLRRVGHSRVHVRTSSLEGALRKIGHLVSVEEVAHGSDR